MKASQRRSLIGDPKLLEILQDEAGKVWLFYGEPYSHAIRTIGATIEDRGDHLALKFRYINLFNEEREPPAAGEITPEAEIHWGEGRPGWDNSPEQQRVLKIAEDVDLPFVQVIELPFLPQKEVRIVDE